MNFNFATLFKAAQQAAALLPVAVQVATTIQAILPPGTSGATKMSHVKDALQGVLVVEQIAAEEFPQIWAHLQPMLDGLIQVMKVAGVSGFSSSTPPAVDIRVFDTIANK